MIHMLNKLIQQAKNPNGRLGSLMLKIMNSAHIQMNQWAFENIKITKNATILDIGCGGGKTLQLLSKMNTDGEIFGIDYSEQAVKNSIKSNKAGVAAGKLHIQQASVYDLPFLENTFDLVTAFQTHYFWDEFENGVKEAFRVLRKHGCFLITAEIYKINYHMRNYKTKESLDKLFNKIGFEKVSFYESSNNKWICIKGIK